MVWDLQTIKFLNSNTDKGKTVDEILKNTKVKTEEKVKKDNDPEKIFSESLEKVEDNG